MSRPGLSSGQTSWFRPTRRSRRRPRRSSRSSSSPRGPRRGPRWPGPSPLAPWPASPRAVRRASSRSGRSNPATPSMERSRPCLQASGLGWPIPAGRWPIRRFRSHWGSRSGTGSLSARPPSRSGPSSRTFPGISACARRWGPASSSTSTKSMRRGCSPWARGRGTGRISRSPPRPTPRSSRSASVRALARIGCRCEPSKTISSGWVTPWRASATISASWPSWRCYWAASGWRARFTCSSSDEWSPLPSCAAWAPEPAPSSRSTSSRP